MECNQKSKISILRPLGIFKAYNIIQFSSLKHHKFSRFWKDAWLYHLTCLSELKMTSVWFAWGIGKHQLRETRSTSLWPYLKYVYQSPRYLVNSKSIAQWSNLYFINLHKKYLSFEPFNQIQPDFVHIRICQ